MGSLVESVRTRVESPERRKFIKYSMVSVVSLCLTVLLQAIFYGIFKWKGSTAAFGASTLAAFPSYYLNRAWVWGKTGRSHWRKEVVPFWAMVVLGLVVSIGASYFADKFAHAHTSSHALRTVIVVGSSVMAFAVLWVAKFVIFNKILFVHNQEQLDPTLDGRTGLPT